MDLAVRASACYGNNVSVDINMEQNRLRQLQKYQEKLKIDSFKVWDPLSIKPGRIGEEQGNIKWSAIYFHYLLNILKQNHPQSLLIDCTLSIISEKYIIILHESLFKKFLSQSFRVFSILYNKNQSDTFPENFPRWATATVICYQCSS